MKKIEKNQDINIDLNFTPDRMGALSAPENHSKG